MSMKKPGSFGVDLKSQMLAPKTPKSGMKARTCPGTTASVKRKNRTLSVNSEPDHSGDSVERHELHLDFMLVKNLQYLLQLNSLEKAKKENNEKKQFELECVRVAEEKQHIQQLEEDLNVLVTQEEMFGTIADKISSELDSLDEEASKKNPSTELDAISSRVKESSKQLLSCVFQNTQQEYIHTLKHSAEEHVKIVEDLKREIQWCEETLPVEYQVCVTSCGTSVLTNKECTQC